ncbi:hypothetical protein ANACOL_01953 [Anaerotruncus colihominis DSM 17241]|uniref:Uncharacterized protein n=1 Tax=Anaerotruncus colihominis DSM 17241 TaxID=445972 RepID=B0PB02_9FIRM|nr:hypothetical protein ANACOL_01953 [Anaerotruncus colihominis DSM 17241]
MEILDKKTGGVLPSPDIYSRLLPAVHFTVLQSKVCYIIIYKQELLGARVFCRYDRKMYRCSKSTFRRSIFQGPASAASSGI